MERMIEIIERGNKTKQTCKGCGCVFTYEPVDVQIEKSPYFGGGDNRYIICPQCNYKIYLGTIK